MSESKRKPVSISKLDKNKYAIITDFEIPEHEYNYISEVIEFIVKRSGKTIPLIIDLSQTFEENIVKITNILYMKNRPPKDRNGIISQMAEECIKSTKQK